MQKKPITTTTLAIALLLSQSSYAAEYRDLKDGDTANIQVSLKEPTRIKVEGEPITNVFGDVAESSTGTRKFVVRKDQDKGELYIQPDPLVIGKDAASSIYVSTSKATYTLLAVVQDIPAETIVIRDKTIRPVALDSSTKERSSAYVRDIKRLIKQIGSDKLDNFHVENINKPVSLWNEASLILEKRITGHPRFIAEQYKLTNVSNSEIVLKEREFYRSGVAAVVLDRHALQVGDSTKLLVLRDGAK